MNNQRNHKLISGISDKGFTLTEVMVSTVVLAIGVVVIFEVFILSLDAINFFNNRLNAQWFLNEKIWQVQNILDQPAAVFVSMQEEGTVVLGKENCNWQVNLHLHDARGELYRADAFLSWEQGRKKITVRRQALVKRYFNNSVP